MTTTGTYRPNARAATADTDPNQQGTLALLVALKSRAERARDTWLRAASIGADARMLRHYRAELREAEAALREAQRA